MAEEAGQITLRGEVVDQVVKNYAMEALTMMQICTVVLTSKETNTYYEETEGPITKTGTTAVTATSFEGVPEGAAFPYVEHSWTEVNERAKKHGADNFLSWEVANLSAIDIKARMLLRVAEAIAHSVDTAIITELATTTNTAAAVDTWDNATESLQQPLKDILTGRAAMKTYHRTATNIYLIAHPNNVMELLNNPVVRNAGTFYTDGVTRNGVIGQVAGCTIIETTAATENTVLMCIGQQAMTWYEAHPLTTHIIEDEGIGYTIRAWTMGVPVLVDNYAAYKITGC